MMAIPTHTPPFKALIILCVISTFYIIHNTTAGRRVPATLDELYSGADDLYHALVDGKEEAEKAKFISTILQNDVEGPFNGTGIRTLCDSRTWDDSLIFMCEAPAGGVGNVRNFLLNCLRYTIEAGAAFVIPEITPRGIGSVEDLFTNEVLPFSYLFDTDHLVNSLNQHCPQLKIHSSIDNLPPSTATPLRLTPTDFEATTFTNALGDMKSVNPTTWHSEFQTWLKTNKQITNKKPNPPPTPTNPLLILLHRTLFDFPISHDPPTFINHFGRLFQFRSDVRRIAATTLYAMSKQYNLNINPSAGIESSKFYGAHLRTADDAKAAHWTGYEQQSRNYLSDATSPSKETSITKSSDPLKLVYVSSGSSKDMTRFSKDAKNHFFVNTTTKHDLLSSSPAYLPVLEELEKLSWDQQALVDYEILSRSSRFGGTSESSFSWNVAQRRHVVFGMQKQRWDWGTSGQWSGLSGEMKVSFGDGLSTVFGPVDHESFFGRTMWP